MHRLKGKVFRGSKAIKKGLLTRAELRSSAWRRLFRDVYADAALTDSHELRCTASGAFLLPEGAAIAGRSAAHVLGGLPLRPNEPVEVLTPRDFGPVGGSPSNMTDVGTQALHSSSSIGRG